MRLDNRYRIHPFALGGSLGLVFFLILFGTNSIRPENIAWLLLPDNQDAIQHFVGWEFFRYEPWHFPFGLITNYGYPVPTSIVYTDSIPILALLFKCLSPWLPENFQYFGLWFVLCFFLQGVFAWALSTCITKDNLIKACITLFFLMSPIMLNRMIEHQALVAHWVILAAFWLYIRPYQSNSNQLWLALNTLTVLIHAYLSVIVLTIWAAFMWKQIVIDSLMNRYQAMKWVLITIATLWIAAWVCGYFVVPLFHIMNAGGYILNAMNLLAPFMPSSGAFIIPDNWSRFIPPFQPQYIEQGDEGFNYLGIGILLLCAVCLYTIYRHPLTKKTITSYLPLLSVCTLLVIYSLSNNLYIGQHLLFSYALPEKAEAITNMFRASGRLFWPAYYFLMITIFFTLNTRVKKPLFTSLLIGALVLQAADLSTKMMALHKRLAITTPTENVSMWKNVKGHYSRIVFIPAIRRPDRHIKHFSDFIHYAAKHNMSVNIGYFARQSHQENVKATKISTLEVLHGNLSEDTLYVIPNPDLAFILKAHLGTKDTITSIGKNTVLYRTPIRTNASVITKKKPCWRQSLIRSHKSLPGLKYSLYFAARLTI